MGIVQIGDELVHTSRLPSAEPPTVHEINTAIDLIARCPEDLLPHGYRDVANTAMCRWIKRLQPYWDHLATKEKQSGQTR